MKNVLYILFYTFFLLNQYAFANNRSMVGSEKHGKLRSGDIGFNDIPDMITNAINYFMGIAGVISIIFIIIGAYQILVGSVSSGDKGKGKNTIIAAIGGFILAALSRFIIKLVLDNFR